MHRLEHANVSVHDPEGITRFMLAAFPDFRVRGEGLDDYGRLWRHVGDDECYVALQAVPKDSSRHPYGSTPGLNHLGFEVDDLDALRARLEAAGFAHNLLVANHPARRRIYFHDPEGNDWEFVEYTTGDRAKRNDYGH
jgi:catechol 2,3-dioxygenase-like lactoylglutathione lyase family enzyme